MFKSKKRTYCSLYHPQHSNDFKQHGFTLVEAVVAITVLSTSLLAVFGVLRLCQTAAGESLMLTKSVLLCEELLAQNTLKPALDYQTIEGTDSVFSWKIQNKPTETDNLAAVCIQVTWLQQQRPKQCELFYLVHTRTQFEGV